MAWSDIVEGTRARRRPFERFRTALRLYGLLAAICLTAPVEAQAELRELAQPSGPVHVSAPTLETAPDSRVRFSLRLSEPLDREVFELREPSRLVIDLPEVEWRLGGDGAAALDFSKHPHVESLRVGLFRPGRSRIVLDLAAKPVDLEHKVTQDGSGAAMLVVEFGFDAAASRQSRLDPAAQVVAAVAKPVAESVALASAARAVRPRPRPRPFVVVVDPGHGGHDSGAVVGGVREKHIVLAVSKLLKRELEKDPRYKVVITRDEDRFVPLPGRVAIAREARADLFLSIHADSLPSHPEVGGASVYTLSDNASDHVAARLARSENAADRLAGIQDAPQEREIRDIVVDYKRRVTMEESGVFAQAVVNALSRRVELLGGKPHRRAGFHVLRNFNAPSALVELGFLTNIKDRRRLTNPAWQETAARALAEAVRGWLKRDAVEMRMARARTAPY